MTTDQQTTLISALKQNDRSAWSAAFERHRSEVYGFIYHLVRADRTVAEDLNQDTWLEALNGIGNCDATRGSFRNWLFGIARKRVALHYRRGALAIKTRSPAEQLEVVAESGDIPVLPEDVLEQVEQRSVVRAAMLVLPDDRRQVLLLKYVEGLSVEAISKSMGRSTKAVESLLSRTREQMRGLLGVYMMPYGDGRQVSKESSNE